MSHCYKSWAQAACESFCNSRAHQGGFLFRASLWSIHRCTNFAMYLHPLNQEHFSFLLQLSGLQGKCSTCLTELLQMSSKLWENRRCFWIGSCNDHNGLFSIVSFRENCNDVNHLHLESMVFRSSPKPFFEASTYMTLSPSPPSTSDLKRRLLPYNFPELLPVLA